jgi:hypothetical protein
VLALVCAGIAFMPSLARRSLPWNATDIHEYYKEARFGSDFVRCLKARIDKEDFDAYAKRLGLTETYDRDKHADLHMQWNMCREAWWDPPNTLDGVRFEPTNGESFFAMAAWREGYVYFVVFSW